MGVYKFRGTVKSMGDSYDDQDLVRLEIEDDKAKAPPHPKGSARYPGDDKKPTRSVTLGADALSGIGFGDRVDVAISVTKVRKASRK